MNRAIYGVLVAWRKAPEAVSANVGDLQGQLDGFIVVDNSESGDPARWDILEQHGWRLIRIANRGNVGLARAMNQGIQEALGQGAEFVLLLDEDSRPAAGMVRELLKVWEKRNALGESIAAIGPNFRDQRTSQHAVFVQVRGVSLRRIQCAAADDAVESDYLISSGSLIHRRVFDDVGMMNEDFFVDLVDTEWCWRARARGYHCYGACGAEMQHAFGEGTITVPMLERKIPYREPTRNYYAFRNSVRLIRLAYSPWRWKLHAMTRLLLLFLLHIFAAPEGTRHARMMLYGVLDGLSGRSGPHVADRYARR